MSKIRSKPRTYDSKEDSLHSYICTGRDNLNRGRHSNQQGSEKYRTKRNEQCLKIGDNLLIWREKIIEYQIGEWLGASQLMARRGTGKLHISEKTLANLHILSISSSAIIITTIMGYNTH